MKIKGLLIASLVSAILVVSLCSQSVTPPVAEAATFRVVGYVTSWSGSVSDIQWQYLTHVNYSFLLPNTDGSLQPIDNPSKLQQVVSAAHSNGVQVLIAMGGWNNGNDSGFEAIAANATLRSSFASNVANFVNQYNLDGVDIDWEYPEPEDASNYTALMQALRSALGSKLLTAAVACYGYNGDGVTANAWAYMDWVNIMAYDGGDGALHSPYSYAVTGMDYWLGKGLPASKAVLGVPFYGRPTWTPYNTLIAAGCSSQSDTCNYQGSLVYYNGQPTIQQKTSLAQQRGGGIMAWELAQDTTDATSLLRTMAGEGGPLPTLPPPPTTGPCTAPAWNASTVYWSGDEVSHNGFEWRARWWTQGEEPGVADVWEGIGPCGGTSPTSVPPTSVPPTGVPPTSVPPTSVPPTATPSGGGSCAGVPQYVAGTSYSTDQEVQNVGNKYRCDVSGWCSSSAAWAYEPGVGMYWETAWTLIGACDGGGPEPTSVPPTFVPPTATPSGGGACTAPAWDASTVHVGGDVVSHNGHEWRAKWWTLGEEPGTTGRWGVWEDLGACN